MKKITWEKCFWTKKDETPGEPLSPFPEKKYGLKFNPELVQEDSRLALLGLQTGPSCSKDGQRYLTVDSS